jgi:hypothetical protein
MRVAIQFQTYATPRYETRHKATRPDGQVAIHPIEGVQTADTVRSCSRKRNTMMEASVVLVVALCVLGLLTIR